MRTEAPDNEAAVTLGDRYRLDRGIAVGGMGEVWQARDLLLERDVAIKLLKAEFLTDPGFLDRFRAEARHTAGLAHPGIASVFDYGEIDDGKAAHAPYIVMELVRGVPLSALLSAGPLPLSQALDIIAQTARALAGAHDGGVIHRDVKPGNILVCPDGTVKVTDFGIARATDAVPLTQTGTVIGTAAYLSPEQASGATTTPASDQYSLGVVAYEMVAGHRPFDATNPVAVAVAHVHDAPRPLPAGVPEPVQALIFRALEKQPTDRYADASAFAAAAEQAAALTAVESAAVESAAVESAETAAMPVPTTLMADAGDAGRTRVLGAVPRVPPPTRRRRPGGPLGYRWLAVAGVVVALFVAAWVYDRGQGNPSSRRPAPSPSAASPSVRATRRSSAPPASSPVSSAATASVPAGLVGQPYDRAAAALVAAGLTPARRLGADPAAAVGAVIAVEPAIGTPLARGATVTLVTSSGPAVASSAPVGPPGDHGPKKKPPKRK